ncbi:MAG: ATP-binding cassette domain-containing protein [Chloroflexota bacterium]
MRFLIGPNGAGKTTLLDVITGKTKPASGSIIFDGAGEGADMLRHPEQKLIRHGVHLNQRQSAEDVATRAEHSLVRNGISRKFQTPSIFPSLSVYDNVGVAACFRRPPLSLYRGMPTRETGMVEHTLEQVGIIDRRHHKAGTLSHGEKQWLEIAMLLVQEPQLLLLDEPVAGMTRRERDRTGYLLQDIVKDRSVVVVEHDMQFVRQFAKVVTVLHLGRVLSEGQMELVQQDPQVVEAYLGHNKARTSAEPAPIHN